MCEGEWARVVEANKVSHFKVRECIGVIRHQEKPVRSAGLEGLKKPGIVNDENM